MNVSNCSTSSKNTEIPNPKPTNSMIVELINQHAEYITRVGLHFLWQGTAIAVLAALVSRYLIESPHHRSAVHLLGLIALALCVPVTWVMLKETLVTTVSQPAFSQLIQQENAQPTILESSAQIDPSSSPP
jgi:hypothetical protein